MRRLLGLLLWTWSGVASAHALDVSTARVTLRDAHVEVIAEIDLLRLLPVDATTLATVDEAALSALLTQAQRRIREETRLEVDGARMPLLLRDFPTAPEVRAIAAPLSAAGQDHGALLRLRLEGQGAVPHAGAVSLALPPSLGPALLSFVQPVARYTPPGEAARFLVLAPPQPLPWRWLGAVLLGMVAAGLLLRRLLARAPERLGSRLSLALLLAWCACAEQGGAADGAISTDAVGATDAAPSTLQLSSSAFTDQGALPVEHTCDGAGRSPPLTWRD